jgi:steroid delta-isomerase-like uncharacterized protein
MGWHAVSGGRAAPIIRGIVPYRPHHSWRGAYITAWTARLVPPASGYERGPGLPGARNRDNVTLFYEVGVNGRNWKVVAELIAPDFTHNGRRLGPDGQRRSLETLYTAFPDVRVTLDDTVFAGDKVATRMTWTGIHRGAFMGLPACGRRVSWTAISIIRLSAGKIAQAWVNEDTLGLLHQIGGVVEARSR